MAHEFKYTNYGVEDTIKLGQKKVKVYWEFDQLTKEGIAKTDKGEYFIVPSCGCTADFEVTDSGVIAYYNDQTKSEQIDRTNNGKFSVSKSVRVFLDDGQDLFEKNDRGVQRPNYTNKKNIILTFGATVEK